jgi:Zn-dependent protease with chaperone function
MSGKEHLQVGPPFSLLILSKEEANAFSYGFGGKGAGGIVVYTGLLDSILASDEAMLTIPHTRSLWQWFQSFVAGRPANPLRRQTTEEQDFQLAAVLAHELGHLLLSHHLETLSSRQVLWPSIIGLGTDIIRVVVWPIT